MQYFLLGLAALLLVMLALRGFAQADVRAIARQIRVVVGVVSLAAAAALMFRGLGSWAGPLGAFGLWMLFGGSGAPIGGRAQKSPGQTSRVVTDYLEMELDHDTGAMCGRVLKGSFAGRAIEDLSPAELASLWKECRFEDPQSAQIIEAYLDAAHPSWRDDMAQGEGESKASAAGGKMSREEAYRILGLAPGASEEEIRRAHRELMLKLHPDRGGSSYLAAKINEAKDVLLGR
ncbi:MAG: molecular chaperone DnaJ [Proteobacteria bacterium]|jgi:hypothetical protein|nr:MAG: molecular chaperone DnaJ [Pseudomonadota bacterium]